ncbi:Transcription factor FER-LIKE IRON DEFICIENCY-INDUCED TRANSCRIPTION FACTOR [Acorus calamus]|uniref:Transcription factor FER-LIKE IRON DEFICIENCY-INDUCED TRANSCRIPTION FACTOR n=1 Tax=Acorus calamus TaxID=4465 RepID=A0AAV9D116_ACOCL|nr:Transcription factor FER-LIKE IRON DEFICIENCY-INDUCED TRANSCRIPTION FACTOR [Acorus calamus]
MDSPPFFMSSAEDDGLERIIDHLRRENFEAVSGDALFGCEGLEEWLYDNNLEYSFSGEEVLSIEGDQVTGDGELSGTTTTATTTKGRRDRSRTLVSERRRRGRMKEKLYQLRALVPNITRMDKASIIGDAEAYVRDLQNQAKTLEEEIKRLESLGGGGRSARNPFKGLRRDRNMDDKRSVEGKISRMDAFCVGEKTFYVRLAYIGGGGGGGGGGALVSVALYASLESIPCFHIESSNFSTSTEESILSLTLQVRDFEEEMNTTTLKQWLAAAFMSQGLVLETLISP